MQGLACQEAEADRTAGENAPHMENVKSNRGTALTQSPVRINEILEGKIQGRQGGSVGWVSDMSHVDVNWRLVLTRTPHYLSSNTLLT